MIPKGAAVVAAVSGGSDSMALLYALNSLKEEYKINLCAAHVNHGLRGEDADRDERFVCEKCEALGVKLYVKRANVAEMAAEQGIGLEECGRNVRYDFFNSLGENVIIATAHNLSDRAETFLFNFARGSALRGLCSIPPVRDNIIRPLIDCSKAEILVFCAKNSVEYVTDATNADVKYSRNRIRHNVITELSKINQSFEAGASRCITSLNEDEAFLSSLAEDAVQKAEKESGFDARILASLPIPVKKRAVIKIVEASKGVTPEYKFVDKICAMLTCSGSMQINGGLTVRVRKGILDFPEESAEKSEVTLKNGAVFGSARIETRIIHSNETKNLQNVLKQGLEYYLDYDKIHGKAVFRSRREGDKIALASRNCTKSLKKLFNELSIPPEKRNSVAVAADDNGVFLVEGAGVDKRVAAGKDTKNILIIRIIRDDKIMGYGRKV